MLTPESVVGLVVLLYLAYFIMVWGRIKITVWVKLTSISAAVPTTFYVNWPLSLPKFLKHYEYEVEFCELVNAND